VSRARWSCLWRRMCVVKTAKRGSNSSLITVLNHGMFVQPLYFVSYYVYWIEYDDYFLFFIFRRLIIIGWSRDTGTIFWPIRNSIRICGWRLDRQVDPIKIRFTGSPTLRPTTCGRPVVFQPLGAPNQYRAPNLRSSWPYSNTRPSSPINTTTYQRSTHNSKRLMTTKSGIWANQSVSSTTKSGVWTTKGGLWTTSWNGHEHGNI
jgi:hypothetical protein